jgi:hypothetical protein
LRREIIMKKNRKSGNGESGPSVGTIFHHSEVPGGQHFMAEFAKDGKSVTIHHDNGGGDTNIGFSKVVDFAIPSKDGRVINCLFKDGEDILLSTLTGRPWLSKKPLRMAI